MKKILLSSAIIIVLLGLAACSNDKSDEKETTAASSTEVSSSSKVTEITLTVDSLEVVADKDGKASITGKTTPGANVAVGFGIVGNSTTAAKDGTFTLKHELDGTEEEELDINATLDSATAKASVKVKPSQEMIDQEAKSKDITQLSEEPTSDQQLILQNLANQRFKEMFPYKGSKIKSALGVIQNWTAVDGHWFYKAEATIVNAFDAKQDTVIEVTITPSGPDSGTVEITNY